MKKFFTILLVLICVLASATCLCSCSNNNSDTDTETQTTKSYEDYLGTYIKELKLAIKKNPVDYNGDQITLKGMFVHKNGETFILDYHNYTTYTFLEHYELTLPGSLDKYAIKIVLADTLNNSLLETWDYVELSGTITILNGEISLSNCVCEILVANDEITYITT